MRLVRVVSLFVVLCWVAAAPTWSDNEICWVTAVDSTVENGVGAEAGVIREFVQDLDVPEGCRTDSGNAWVLALELRVTRVEPSSPIVAAEVGVRRLETVRSQQPAQVFIESRFIEVTTNTFPQLGIEWTSFPGTPRAGQAMGVGPAVRFNGDVTTNQFLTVDQSPATPVRTCWTRIGTQPWEQCTNGLPSLRAVGLALQVTPYLADLPLLGPTARITVDQPDLSNGIDVDLSGTLLPGITIETVELVDPGNPIPICSSPGILPFQCSLTTTQAALLRQSELLVLVMPQIVPPSEGARDTIVAPLVSADDYLFANGFEGGDPELWSVALP